MGCLTPGGRERSLATSRKTILPRDTGGVAGGTKFIERGIFIKFACDVHGTRQWDA